MFLSFCYIYKYFVRPLKVFQPPFCHFCACEMSPGWGHLITWMDPSVGHLNGILARVGGIWTIIFKKVKCPGGCPGGHVEASIWPIHYRHELLWSRDVINCCSCREGEVGIKAWIYKPILGEIRLQHLYQQWVIGMRAKNNKKAVLSVLTKTVFSSMRKKNRVD